MRHGWHETERAPFRVQRFLCRGCRRTFSTQTFDYSYFQKRPELDRSVFFQSRGGACNRQIAVNLGCGKSTVAEKIKRLARQAQRFQERELANATPFVGDVLFDGLGTFEHSKYLPFWMNIAVHRDSSFVFGVTESPLRRSGKMRPEQKRERDRIEALVGRPNPRAVRDGTADLLRAIERHLSRKGLRFVTDEHRAYPLALRDAGLHEAPHLRISSKKQRTSANPLFEINLADLRVRHDQSSQKRETIAFNKRRQAGLERAWIWIVWKNFMAPRRVKGPRGRHRAPAVLAGIRTATLTYDDLFRRRVLPEDGPLSVGIAWSQYISPTRTVDESKFATHGRPTEYAFPTGRGSYSAVLSRAALNVTYTF